MRPCLKTKQTDTQKPRILRQMSTRELTGVEEEHMADLAKKCLSVKELHSDSVTGASQ